MENNKQGFLRKMVPKHEKRMTEISFSEFKGEWKQIRLEDRAIIKGRLGWKSLKQQEYLSDGPSMISGKHIKSGLIDWRKVDHIPQWRYEESPEIMLENGDIIFSKDGSLGNPALISNLNCLATINSTMMLVRVNETIDPSFFYQVMRSERFKRLIHLKVSGSSIPHLFQADMNDFLFEMPEKEEQQKIGEFFKQLDDTIALQQRQLERLKESKQGFLQKMFPKDGARVPEVRFDGFNGDWKEYKFGELGSVVMNKRVFKSQTSENGEIPFYKIGTFGKTPNAFIARSLFEEYKSKYPYPKIGDILISASGSIGRTVEYNGEDAYFQDSNIIWIEHDDRLINSFLKQFYLIVEWQGVEGSTIKRLYNRNILNTVISLAGTEEQQKIGEFFKQLDDTIALHEKELDLLKETKKGFLQKMFV